MQCTISHYRCIIRIDAESHAPPLRIVRVPVRACDWAGQRLATSVKHVVFGNRCVRAGWCVAILLDRSQEPQVVDMKAFSSGHSPPKGAHRDRACGLRARRLPASARRWLHPLEKQIAAGQLTVEGGRADGH